MKIAEMFKQGKPILSFEVFPPKPEFPIETVYQTVEKIKDLNPAFISVTYGAGGSSRRRTLEIASHIKTQIGIETMAHLTCLGHSPVELEELLTNIKSSGIENVLALRGDFPQDDTTHEIKPGNYRYAVELVQHIKRSGFDFSIGAAAYPEGHQESRTWSEDWEHLRNKVEAGVDFLITQLYFDNRVFYNFRENLAQMGVNIPISAGIMPIADIAHIKRMVCLSNASLPPRLIEMFDKYDGKPEELKKAGLEYAINQINDLIDNDVAGIHLYTMNRAEQTRQIVENINI